jgi:hypothetical protein
MASLRGSCLCGAVTFTLAEAPNGATACHCTQCRKGDYYDIADGLPQHDP